MKQKSIKEIEEIKRDLERQAMVNDLLLTPEERILRQQVAKGIQDIPVRKIMDAALHMREVILPQIEKRSGTNSDNYKFFTGVYEYLLWAVVLVDRFESLNQMMVKQKILNTLLMQQSEALYAEIQKYCTLEDFFLSDGLRHVSEGYRKRAEELLKTKK